MATQLNDDELKSLRGIDHDALVDWRHKHREEMLSSDYAGMLKCPLTGFYVCETCLWTMSGPCYCDFSYG